jgi:hypothetical protein
MKFIHAVVFDKKEYETIIAYGDDLTDWGIVCDGDYVVHALYDCEKKAVIILNDNTHTNIVDEIASFCRGIRYCGNEVEIIKAYVVMNEKEDSYSWAQVCEHIVKGEYVEVKD